MPTYRVNVVVEYDYEVEAENLEEAEEQGWYYADHSYHADVYSIKVDEVPEVDEEDENE
jgi:hypothetical protein